MHIPDGFLSTGVSIAGWAASAGGLGYALRRVNKTLGERQVPLLGVTAAFIFAAQMLNFAVIGGTSGHLLGAALAAILLGPWAGILVLTSVNIIQALLFQDGGLLALGANVFNMALVGVLVGWVTYRLLIRLLGGRTWSLFAGGFLAGWLSAELTALATAAELALSGTMAWQVVVPAMGGIYALIGVGEGLITVAVLAFLRVVHPDLLTLGRSTQSSEESVS
jgi:cobalt/nickel transport system permease protein